MRATQAQVSRRAALTGLAGASVLTLAGCGVRLESDAPFLTPSPDPAGPALLAERARVTDALALARRLPATASTELVDVHTVQLRALDAAVARLDPVPTASPTAPANDEPRPDPRRLVDLELADLDEPGQAALDALLPRAAEIVVASATQRLVAARLVTSSGTTRADVPALPWAVASPRIGTTLLDAVRSAAYGVEVGAARSRGPGRSRLLRILRDLRAVESALVGLLPDAPARPLGYRLLGRMDTPGRIASAVDGVLTRLGTVAVAASVDTASALREAGDDPDAPPGATGASPTRAATSGSMATLVRLASLAETSRLVVGPVRPMPTLAAAADARPPTASPGPTRD